MADDLMYPLVMDDGGRHLSKPLALWAETNDCTVRALAIALGLSYSTVHATLKKAGRRANRGFELTDYLSHRRPRLFLGRAFQSDRFRRKTTITDVLKAYPKGRLVLDLDDHVMALIDGTVHDQIRLPSTERVLGVWRFLTPGPRPEEKS